MKFAAGSGRVEVEDGNGNGNGNHHSSGSIRCSDLQFTVDDKPNPSIGEVKTTISGFRSNRQWHPVTLISPWQCCHCHPCPCICPRRQAAVLPCSMQPSLLFCSWIFSCLTVPTFLLLWFFSFFRLFSYIYIYHVCYLWWLSPPLSSLPLLLC